MNNPQPAPSTVPCSLCGRPIDSRVATLSMSTGLPTCPACIGGEALYAQQGRAIRALAWGALGGSFGAGCAVLPCCLPIGGVALAVAALVSGIRALTLLNRPDYRQRPDRGMLLGISITGIVIASLVGLFGVLEMTLLAAAMGSAAMSH